MQKWNKLNRSEETEGNETDKNQTKRNERGRKRTKKHHLLSHLQNVISTTSTSHILSKRHQHNFIFSHTVKTSSAQPRLLTYYQTVISTTSTFHIISKHHQHNFIFKTSSAQPHLFTYFQNIISTTSSENKRKQNEAKQIQQKKNMKN